MTYHVFIKRLSGVLEIVLAVGFAALIITVALQVGARGILKIPLIWTLDVAQLLFSWLVFLGAALAYHRRAHYLVDLLPEDWATVRKFCDILTVIAALLVIYLMVYHGWQLVELRWKGMVQALGISRSWMFMPIPVSGTLIALYLVGHLLPSEKKVG